MPHGQNQNVPHSHQHQADKLTLRIPALAYGNSHWKGMRKADLEQFGGTIQINPPPTPEHILHDSSDAVRIDDNGVLQAVRYEMGTDGKLYRLVDPAKVLPVDFNA